jgi:uncharacterized protein (DUF697 family)/predicted GTPase
MAIDKDRTPKLVAEINALFDAALGGLNMPSATKQFVRDKVMGPALREVEQLITNSRPPRIYLFGRSGHGKSSILNALADREIATVGDIEPTTTAAEPVIIDFSDKSSKWEVIDSRGIFESTRPLGATSQDPLTQVKDEVVHYKPDVILHVIAAPEVRTLENDIKAYKAVCQALQREVGVPTLIVVNKADTIGGGREWPPDTSAKKRQLIINLLDYTSRVIGVATHPISPDFPEKGYQASGGGYVGIIPACSFIDDVHDDRWNIETLSKFIGEHLPRDAQLAFYQGQGRMILIRSLSTNLIRRFATISAMIGSTPTPFVDNVVLAPLQMLMVACVGGLSCRSFTTKTARDYVAASGLVIGGLQAVGVLRGFVELALPVIGLAISGAIAAASTYGIGKAAEAYFFSGEIKDPSEFRDEFALQQ